MTVILAFKKDIKPHWNFITKFMSKVVQYWTGSNYYHVELILEDKWISSNTKSGVHIHSLKPLRDTSFDYFEFTVPEYTLEQRKVLWDFLRRQTSTGYDWKGIFLSQGIALDIEKHDRWFCSEIVTRILQQLYVSNLMDVKPSRVSPARLYDILCYGLRKLDSEEIRDINRAIGYQNEQK